MLHNTKTAVANYLQSLGKPVSQLQVNKIAKNIINSNLYVLYYSMGEIKNAENFIKQHINYMY